MTTTTLNNNEVDDDDVFPSPTTQRLFSSHTKLSRHSRYCVQAQLSAPVRHSVWSVRDAVVTPDSCGPRVVPAVPLAVVWPGHSASVRIEPPHTS